MRFFIILSICILSTVQVHAYHSSSVNGKISLGGALQALVTHNKLPPIGNLTSYYGYDVLDATNIPASGGNRALSCFGGVSVGGSPSLLGISFGGDVSENYTFGKCESVGDYTEGGAVEVSVDFQVHEKGSQSVNVGAALSISFDMNEFSKTMARSYVNSDTKKSLKNKMAKAVIKILQFIDRNSANEKLQSHGVVAKLSLVPMYMALGIEKTGRFKLGLTAFEKNFIKNKKMLDTKLSLQSSLEAIRYSLLRDPVMNSCLSEDCIETFTDVLILLDAIKASYSTCHNFSVNLSLESDFSVTPDELNSKVSFTFGYSWHVLEKEFNSQLGTAILAQKYFWGHNFNDRSQSCKDASTKAAEGFSDFINLFSLQN